MLVQSKPKRSVLGGLVKSYAVGYGLNEIAGQETRDCPRAIGFFYFPAPKGQNEIAQGKAKRRPGYVPGFFPTVAWPSEDVRVGDVSIAFIHKRVGAPFYGPRGVPGLIKAQTQRPGGLG